MVATKSLQTVPLAENRRWYHRKCVQVKGYYRKQEEFHVISVTSQLILTPKLLSWHHCCFHDCNYEEFKPKQIFIMYVQAF